MKVTAETPRDTAKTARIFKALSVETRVRIVQLLKGRALCVNALAGMLDITAAAVSQHLRILRDASLVVAEKRGYHVHYRIDEETFTTWREIADSFFSVRESMEQTVESPGTRKISSVEESGS